MTVWTVATNLAAYVGLAWSMQGLTWVDYGGITMLVVSWWVAKNIDDDDDRWRRRRRKVVEKIRRVGNRLVPVPVSAVRSVL